jgi:hypothetical protein
LPRPIVSRHGPAQSGHAVNLGTICGTFWQKSSAPIVSRHGSAQSGYAVNLGTIGDTFWQKMTRMKKPAEAG